MCVWTAEAPFKIVSEWASRCFDYYLFQRNLLLIAYCHSSWSSVTVSPTKHSLLPGRGWGQSLPFPLGSGCSKSLSALCLVSLEKIKGRLRSSLWVTSALLPPGVRTLAITPDPSVKHALGSRVSPQGSWGTPGMQMHWGFGSPRSSDDNGGCTSFLLCVVGCWRKYGLGRLVGKGVRKRRSKSKGNV